MGYGAYVVDHILMRLMPMPESSMLKILLSLSKSSRISKSGENRQRQLG